VSKEEIDIVQGSSDSVVSTVTNTGDFPLNLNVTIEKNCCSIDPVEGFKIELKESKDFPVNIHVPLSQQPGAYIATIEVFSSTVRKENSIKINVKENPLIPKIIQLEAQLTELESKIEDHKTAGVYVLELEELAGNIKTALSNAQSSITQDDLKKLETHIRFAGNNLDLIENRLSQLGVVRLLAENKFNIAGGMLIAILLSFMITQIIIPYIRLGKDIRILINEEKNLVGTRQATEKQYFTRKIDEKTFNVIMISGQGKILKARSQIKIKKDTRSNLIKSKLTPKTLFNWIKSGPKKLGSKLRRNKKAEFVFPKKGD